MEQQEILLYYPRKRDEIFSISKTSNSENVAEFVFANKFATIA